MSRTNPKSRTKPQPKKPDPKLSAKRKQQAKTRKKRTDFQQGFYLDHERFAALALADTEGVTNASRKTGIPERTIYAWKDGFRCHQAAELYREKAGDMARAFEAVAWECVAMARERLGEAPFNHLMTGAGIAVDKGRLIQGQPTQIADNRNTNVEMDAFLRSLTPEQLELFYVAGEATTVRADAVAGQARTGAAGAEQSRALRAVVLADPEPR